MTYQAGFKARLFEEGKARPEAGTTSEVDVWKPHSHWENHPEYSAADWRAEVFADNTRLGYVDWVNAQLEAQHP